MQDKIENRQQCVMKTVVSEFLRLRLNKVRKQSKEFANLNLFGVILKHF